MGGGVVDDAGVAFELVAKTLSDNVQKYFPEDGPTTRFFMALGQMSIGTVLAGASALASLALREYLTTNEREIGAMKLYVKHQQKVLVELDEFRRELATALRGQYRAEMPPPPDQHKFGILMEEEKKDEGTILDLYRHEKFRIQQRLESLEAKVKIYNQGSQQMMELVTRKKVPLSVLNMYVAEARSTCRQLDKTIAFGEKHLVKILKQTKSSKETLFHDPLGHLTLRDLGAFIRRYHQYLKDLEEQGAYAYLFIRESEYSKHVEEALDVDELVEYHGMLSY